MNQSIELSLAQEFGLRSFADQVQHMSREQAQEFLIKLHEHMVLKENMYKSFLRDKWEIESDQMFG
jgi:hypothetical protein